MQFISSKKECFKGTVLYLWTVGKINWSKGNSEKQILSKNPEVSSLSAKCAIALCMMNAKTIQRNVKSSFPLIASQEIRFYESSGFIIFKWRRNFRSTKGQRVCSAHEEAQIITNNDWANCGLSAKILLEGDNNTKRIPFSRRRN